MAHPWLAQYAPGIPSEIQVGTDESLSTLLVSAFDTYADARAFSNLGNTLTFSEVEDATLRVARFLLEDLGLAPGDRVAIMMPNCLQYPAILFGALTAGMTVVNVNPLYRAHEIAHQVADAGARAIFVIDQAAAELAEGIDDTPLEHVIVTRLGDMLGALKGGLVNFSVKHLKKLVPNYRFERTVTLGDALAGGPIGREALPTVVAADIAFLQYTGGTTGRAKGAVLTHGNLVANVRQLEAWFRDVKRPRHDVMVTALPLYHVFALTANCLLYFTCGGCNLLVTNPRDIDGFVKLLKGSGWTAITGVNTLYQGLLNHPGFADLDFSTLKLAIAGGMALQKSTAERWLEVTGLPITEGYGLSETSPVLTCNPIGLPRHTLTAGIPLPSTEVSIRDDAGLPVSSGTPGELTARGPQVMREYWQRPEETAAAFTTDGYFKTGDIAVMDENGYCRIVDRKKDMILVSGFNVYPNEVEDVAALHPSVLEAACIGLPDERSGEAVGLWVVPRAPGDFDKSALVAWLRDELAAYKIPRYLVVTDALPKSNVGKVLRRELRDAVTRAGELPSPLALPPEPS